MVQKNAASVLTAMGLQEEGLIVDSLEAYRTKAVALASDAKARRALVKKIKQSRYLHNICLIVENIKTIIINMCDFVQDNCCTV
jgi:predicted O-linked N-acetylglucosamine transferase (SPINDLY family)